MQLLTALNDTGKILTHLRGLNMELGRYFSTEGYGSCTLYALGIDGGLYKVTTEYREGAPFNGQVGTICYKKDFEVDPEFKGEVITDNEKRAELEKSHFLRALDVTEWDNIVEFDRNTDIETVQYIYDAAFAIYSPILHL